MDSAALGTTGKLRRILLIEDDLATGKTLKSSLETMGFSVDWVSQKAPALEHLEKSFSDPYALILSDLYLEAGQSSALELIKKLRALEVRSTRQLTPLVVMTGYGHLLGDEDRSLLQICRVNEVLPKPFKKAELMDSIVRAMSG
jgi:CheY-like chemotaxis protein